MDSAKQLKNGQCDLRDGSVAGQWRLPSQEEWETLIDKSVRNPALPSGHPFTSVQSNYYWSSTTYAFYAPDAGSAFEVNLENGYVEGRYKTGTYYVWPVRGGQ